MHALGTVPLYAVAPFVLLLVCIAVLPLAAPHAWEDNRVKAAIAGTLSAPIVVWLLLTDPGALGHTLVEYASFLALLGALYVIAGGIYVGGDLAAHPRTNTTILGVGAVLANVVGTTGASMVLIRLLLRTNQQRTKRAHLPLFFILIVSNVGGLLTPLGDPPLFLGYLRGVPFSWTLRLLPMWAVAVGYLLALFYAVDRLAYRHEASLDVERDERERRPLYVEGRIHALLLGGVVAAVFAPTPWREGLMVALALASLYLGTPEQRAKNGFGFGPIVEVAVLFAGIFVTMVPALVLLGQHGGALGLDAPWQFFLATGVLSSVLDNAPTYVTFLAAAQSLQLTSEVVGVPHLHLAAISLGAVLMGANTYIGNGPNFMVKAIAEAAGYETPSFLGYALRAVAIMAPLYLALLSYFLIAG